MEKDNFESWKNKKVFLITKSGRRYEGVIKETTPNFIFLITKFAEKVTISISEINILEEES